MLTNKVEYGTLFSNLSNVEKLFASMILVVGYCVKNSEIPKSQDNDIDKLLSINADNRTETIKAILRILSSIGYTNLWADSYNGLKNLEYLKDLRNKVQFKE